MPHQIHFLFCKWELGVLISIWMISCFKFGDWIIREIVIIVTFCQSQGHKIQRGSNFCSFGPLQKGQVSWYGRKIRFTADCRIEEIQVIGFPTSKTVKTNIKVLETF